jgi:Tfp pilus assembly protein PilX
MKAPGAPHSGTRSPRLTRELSGFLKHLLASKTRQSDHGSALILTLLITALLATIVVSFLSTSRVEQIAARNFSRQNAATGLAEMATQQAMAKIQQGFTVNGTGTTIITTQPGAIRQFVFNNGTCTPATPVTLYSENGTVPADLNNLQNPGNTTEVRGNVSANQTFTITGNASNRLLVKMEDVTSNGTLVGRIAYYVDDELTKININAATDNRTTLNVSTPRSMSLSAFTTANLTTFRSIVDGTISNDPSSINSWGYFFRKEQADKVTGFNGNQMSNISTAPLSDFHLKYTPWGARRLHINDELLNSTGVDNVYAALASNHLKNIYGGSFDDKYGKGWSWYGSNTSVTSNLTAPVNGLKQIAANMLQMRSANTANLTSGGYRISNPVIGNNGSSAIPSSYFAHTPYAVINEFAMQIQYNDYWDGSPDNPRGAMIIQYYPFIEIVAPMQNPYGGANSTAAINPTYCLEYTIRRIILTLRDSLGATTTSINNNPNPRNSYVSFSSSAEGFSGNKSVHGGFTLSTSFNGNTVAFTTNMWPYWPYELPYTQINTFNNGNVPAFWQNWNVPWQITGNVTIEMGDIKLYAGTTPDPNKLLDWIPAEVINSLLGNGTTQSDINGPNSGKIQIPKLGTNTTTFQIKEPATSSVTGVLTLNRTTGEFISAEITMPSYNGYWPYTPPSTAGTVPYSRTTTSYPDRNSYNATLTSLFGSPNRSYTVNSTNTTKIVTIGDPSSWMLPNITRGNLTASNAGFLAFSSLALRRSTANFGDISGMQNVSIQRVDPRIRGYGNSTTGYSNWVVAPNTFCRHVVNGNLTDIISSNYRNLTGNNTSNNLMAGHNTFNGTLSDGARFGDYGLRPSETQNRHIPGDPSSLGDDEPDIFIANEGSSIYFAQSLNTFDASGNATFNTPHDLGKVMTNVNWRRLRFMPRHSNENAANLIPDWAMLDAISFSSNNSSSSMLKIAPINPNGAFAYDTTLNNSTAAPAARNNLPALLKALESNSLILGSSIAKTVAGSNMTFDKADLAAIGSGLGNASTTFRGSPTLAASVSANITSNSTTKWSTTNSTWSAWRSSKGWPSTNLVMPGEATEIRGVADYGARSQYDYSSSPGARSIKENEGRLSAFFPGLTTCSNFFTIYAYAQAGQLKDKNQPESASNPFVSDSEALTKSLVEVEITTPATATAPAQYKVKKLYTQPIPLGQ